MSEESLEGEKDLMEILKRELPLLLKGDAGFRIELVSALEGVVLTKEDYAKIMDLFVKLKNDFMSKIAEVEDLLKSLTSKIDEMEKKVNEYNKIIEEIKTRISGFESSLNSMKEEIDKIKSVSKVPVTEEVYQERVRDILSQELGTKLRSWVVYDADGLVYGHPATVEALLAVTGKGHFLVKIKPIVTPADVGEMKKIGELYYKKLSIEPRLLIVGNYINEEARRVAKEIGVEVRTIE